MATRNPIETVMGAVVLAVAGFFLVFSYSHADLGTVRGYDVSATFPSTGGLASGSNVSINGIKVGTVIDQYVDPQSFNAIVTMSIRPDIHLPDDTVASIDSDGLLGGKFVALTPGHSGKVIAAGGQITQTKPYQSLEDLVQQVIFAATTKPDAPAPQQQNAPGTQPAPGSGVTLPTLGDNPDKKNP